MDLVIAPDDPGAADVQGLLARHLAFAQQHSPPDQVYVLDDNGLRDPLVLFFSVRRNGSLLGVGALKRLDDRHGELKSMHVDESARGQGVGRALVIHLLDVAAACGMNRVSIETGRIDAFAPAHALYSSVGFTPCEPFAEYADSDDSVFMSLALADMGTTRRGRA